MASLKPKLFCGVAFWREVSFCAGKHWNNRSCGACHLRHNNCQTTSDTSRSSNASTPTEPTGRCFCLLPDLRPETGDYTGERAQCQAAIHTGFTGLPL